MVHDIFLILKFRVLSSILTVDNIATSLSSFSNSDTVLLVLLTVFPLLRILLKESISVHGHLTGNL